MKKLINLILINLLLVSNIFSQGITGDWFGIRNYPQRNLRITLHIEKDSSGFLATFDNPDFAKFNIPFDSISIKESFVFFSWKLQDISFIGVADLGKQKITGIYKQVGTKKQQYYENYY